MMSKPDHRNPLASFIFEARTRSLAAATENWLALHPNLKGDKAAKAAAFAYVQASRNPGCLVRIVEKPANAERLIDIASRVAKLCLANGLFDAEKSRATFDAGKTLIELLNGSGIEFSFDLNVTG